jgi:hypothetical protein
VTKLCVLVIPKHECFFHSLKQDCLTFLFTGEPFTYSCQGFTKSWILSSVLSLPWIPDPFKVIFWLVKVLVKVLCSEGTKRSWLFFFSPLFGDTEFELRALHLLGRHSTLLAALPALELRF